MTPQALVAALEARGARIRAREDGALLIEPQGILQEAEREALRAQKAAVVSLLRERQARTVPGVDWSRLWLYQLDSIIEIAAPWSDAAIILAPGCNVARELRARDQKPGRIWCCCEVIDMLLSGVRPEDARATAQAKGIFHGAVVSVRPGQQP